MSGIRRIGPLSRRLAPRSSNPFRIWVRQTTVPRVVQEFAHRGHPVTASAVQNWAQGIRSPRLVHAQILLSIGGGAFRLEDVLAQRAPQGTAA